MEYPYRLEYLKADVIAFVADGKPQVIILV